jgi:MFS family permease
MPALVAVSLTGFSGYAALLATAPAWTVHGGASEAGAGLVNGVLLAATVLTQMCVPWLLRAFGTAPVMVASMFLMGVPAAAYALSDALVPVLALSAVRGAGFGIITVVGSTVVAHLVEPARRGEAVGVYGLAVAAPMIVLLSASVAVAESAGYGWVFAVASLPLLGVPWAWWLGRRVDATPTLASEEVSTSSTSQGAVRLVLRPTAVLFAVTMAGGALMTFAPQLGIGGGWAAAALFVMSLTSALSRWRVGLLADRHGPERFVAPLLVLTAVGLLLCVGAITRDSGWLLVLAALVLGPPYGALQNLTLLIAFARVPARDLPTASAAWNLGFDAGTATGSVVVGALATAFAFGPAFAVMVVVVLAALLLAPRRPAEVPA